MILATRFTFIFQRSRKNMRILTQKWLDHLLLMKSYLVSIATDQSLNLSQKVRRRWTNIYWKLQVLMFYALGKKLRKTVPGVASTPPSPPPVRPRVKQYVYRKNLREGRTGVAVRIEGNKPKGRNMIQRKKNINLTGKKFITSKQESALPRVEPEPSFDSQTFEPRCRNFHNF